MTIARKQQSMAGGDPGTIRTADMTKEPVLDPVVDTLARTLYGEARGERVLGLEAVAAVILNRARRARLRGRYWWGSTIEEICRRPWQFSCWNNNDPNRMKIEAVGVDNKVFQTCVRVAERAIRGDLEDPTDGATHYHTMGVLPPWTRGRSPSAKIGRHLFYNDVE